MTAAVALISLLKCSTERKGPKSHKEWHKASYSHIIAHWGRMQGGWWPDKCWRRPFLSGRRSSPVPPGPAPRPPELPKWGANFNFLNPKLMKYEPALASEWALVEFLLQRTLTEACLKKALGLVQRANKSERLWKSALLFGAIILYWEASFKVFWFNKNWL